ncbi:hypothetical protein QQS21_000479 [Conoideocrella luteorostrata]|uniref:Rho-GAP domain-containing protein n=1 Tax=Conoideocrella luteorostrata TaxID=1105319 RepID=A0AAJ0G2S8_9HYPO|nr:hypothetical protein QQS21_000479 [Conoideocrella luteorostrata]
MEREVPRIMEIQEMVRLGGKSILYLPQDYSPSSLILPTCIRATAQYLAQNVGTRGLFRVPGSARVIGALFDYYCYMDNGNATIAKSVRCATLPIHIQYSVHDVASTFKRLLSVLPGGILGSLALFDAFIAVHSQLNGEPEYPRTKQTKVRARLIALAIGTVKSQYRRELICSVFGLLSLIGRVAEIAPREDEDSRPLPTADLMGYNALGIVFGPLLVGDLLDQYTMKVATPSSGMLLFPLSPPRFRKDRRKSLQNDITKSSGPPTVDKILVANNITQMLIANWRDVVRQMKSLGTHYRKDTSTVDLPGKHDRLQAPQGFHIRAPKDLDEQDDALSGLRNQDRREPETPTHGPKPRKLKILRRPTSQRLLPKMSIATLSPTQEESMGDDESSDIQQRRESVIQRLDIAEKRNPETADKNDGFGSSQFKMDDGRRDSADLSLGNDPRCIANDTQSIEDEANAGPRQAYLELLPPKETARESGPRQAYLELVPPRESSRQVSSLDGTQNSSSHHVSVGDPIGGHHLLPWKEDASEPNDKGQSTGAAQSFVNSEDQDVKIVKTPRRSTISTPTPRSEKRMSEGGIRLVQASPIREDRAKELGSTADDDTADLGGTGTPYLFQDQGVQCHLTSELERRHSIDTTPERFYPWGQNLPLLEGLPPDKTHNHPRQTPKTQRQQVLLHGHRLSRSHGNLRSQALTTLQSPTESTKSRSIQQRESVKAMAAMIETQASRGDSSATTGDVTPATTENKIYLRDRHFKSDSTWTQGPDSLEDSAQPCLAQESPSAEGTKFNQVLRSLQDSRVRSSTGQCHGESLDSDMDGAYHQTPNPRRDRPNLTTKPNIDRADGKELKPAPGLGTTLSFPEQPPIAHHLNLARPPSSPSPMPESEPLATLDIISGSQVSRTGSATVLHSQIRKLQRQLNGKMEEASQLRRQLEAQQDSDVGTMSEQIWQAKRDVAMWKGRAETAERRIKVFEKFIQKLKEIRDAIADTKTHKPSDRKQSPVGPPNLGGQAARAIEALDLLHVTDAKECSGMADGTSAVTAKTQKCSHGLSGAQDGTYSQASGSAVGEEFGNQSPCSCLATDMRTSSDQIWAAAKELLEMEEDEKLRP